MSSHGGPDYFTLFRSKILFHLAEHRQTLYFVFGLTCLAGWLFFNLWILRDYFFPSCFEQLYNEQGLSKRKLSIKKKEIQMRQKVSRAFSISASIPLSASAHITGGIKRPSYDINQSLIV